MFYAHAIKIMKPFLKKIVFRFSFAGMFFMLPLMSFGFDKGQPFPDRHFPALEDGTPVSLTDYQGQKVVLHVFASW